MFPCCIKQGDEQWHVKSPEKKKVGIKHDI